MTIEASPGVESDLPDSLTRSLDPLVPDAVRHASFVPTPEGRRAGESRWWGRHLHETRWTAEAATLTFDPIFYGVGVRHGHGGRVLLIPGFLAADTSLSVMAGWLFRIGYRPHFSGIRVANVDCSDHLVDRLETRLERIAGRAGGKVAIIGHSRGGHLAKALASRRPDLVRAVISMGSALDKPFDISVPTKAAVAGVRGALTALGRSESGTCLTDTCSCAFTRDFCAPFPGGVPLTSIYSKGDGVVRWPACVVPYARNVEVPGSHVGLAFNRHAYRVVADALFGAFGEPAA